MENPSLWNWQLINKRAGQIIRRMKKLAHTGLSPSEESWALRRAALIATSV
jgi:hypothetical protein